MLRSRDRLDMKKDEKQDELERIEKLEKQVHLIEEYELKKSRGMLVARSVILTIGDKDMPATILVGGNGAKAVFTEFTGLNGTGNVIAPILAPVFSSSDTTIATVDQSGNITAVAPGAAVISAIDSGNNLSASDTVTVNAAAPPPPPPPVAQSATMVVTAVA